MIDRVSIMFVAWRGLSGFITALGVFVWGTVSFTLDVLVGLTGLIAGVSVTGLIVTGVLVTGFIVTVGTGQRGAGLLVPSGGHGHPGGPGGPGGPG